MERETYGPHLGMQRTRGPSCQPPDVHRDMGRLVAGHWAETIPEGSQKGNVVVRTGCLCRQSRSPVCMGTEDPSLLLLTFYTQLPVSFA